MIDVEGAFLKAWEANAVGVSRHDQLQAALAAAYPALVQQVERLTKTKDFLDDEVGRLDAANKMLHAEINTKYKDLLSRTQVAIAKRDALSAANARLAKDAERLNALIHIVLLNKWADEEDEINEAINDALAAQAKQAEGGK